MRYVVAIRSPPLALRLAAPQAAADHVGRKPGAPSRQQDAQIGVLRLPGGKIAYQGRLPEGNELGAGEVIVHRVVAKTLKLRQGAAVQALLGALGSLPEAGGLIELLESRALVGAHLQNGVRRNVAAFKQYAYESYEVNALDFLLKPIRYQKFLAAIEKARQWFDRDTTPADITPRQTSMFIRVDNMLRQVDFDKILYVSGLKDYVNIYLEGERRPVITHLTMKSVEEMLPTDRFMRVHRSYIIALDKIRAVDRNNCVYIGEEVIRVTDAYREAFTTFLDRKMPR